MSTLPLPVRVAVGLAITAVEQARKLPEQLIELPMTAASRAVQVAMRVQQRVTELAIKGDQVCALFHPVQDAPPWAHFDEDDEPDVAGTRTNARGFDATTDGAARAAVVPGIGHDASTRGAGEIDEADVARAMSVHPPATNARPEESQPERAQPANTEMDWPGIHPPPALPEYNELSLAQLRGKLRALSLPELTELLAYERGHQDRAAFVTMLSNRISTVSSQ